MASSILPANSDYTTKDFDALKLRLVSLIKSVFPTWTDFSVTNFGNILMEAFCFAGDVLTFYQDNQAAESRIVTATQRRSLLALVKLLDYTPHLAGAATVDVTLTAASLSVNCVVPAGQVFKTESSEPVEFQLLSPVTLTPGALSAEGTLENSKTEEQTYEGTGRGNQQVVLAEAPFLGIVSVVGASSGQWSQEDNLLFTRSSEKAFTVLVDNNDLATLTFPDGTNGVMPSDILTIRYKTGGGAIGNVAAHSITKVDGSVVDVAANPVTLTCDHDNAASGGIDRQSEASIKALAPVSIRNPTSSIARTDFEDHALEVTGVTRAVMLSSKQTTFIQENEGRLYVVPSGNPPAFPSAAKLDEVRRLFVSDTQGRPLFPAPLTFNLTVLPAVYLDITVNATIYLVRDAVAADVKTAIIAALTAFFAPETSPGTPNPLINFGYYLRVLDANLGASLGQMALSDIVNVVRDVSGVRKISPTPSNFTIDASSVTYPATVVPVLTGAHQDIELQDTWFPRFAGVNLINGDTGAVI